MDKEPSSSEPKTPQWRKSIVSLVGLGSEGKFHSSDKKLTIVKTSNSFTCMINDPEGFVVNLTPEGEIMKTTGQDNIAQLSHNLDKILEQYKEEIELTFMSTIMGGTAETKTKVLDQIDASANGKTTLPQKSEKKDDSEPDEEPSAWVIDK